MKIDKYDPLTGIPLRTTFMERLKLSIADAEKKGLKLAVLYLDIGNLKTVNDIYGYHICDRFIKKIAGNLKLCIRNTDTLCRIGEDEFALLVKGFSSMCDIDEIAQKILKLFDLPLYVSGYVLYSTISIGIAIYPDNGCDYKALLKKANIALYKAKEEGKNNLQYFNNYLSMEADLRIDIKKGLRAAIANEEFFLCYQPLIDTKTKNIVCLEALIRWKHPKRGIISPMEFIHVAEETGLIVPIGEWVLQTACRQLKEWNSLGHRDYCISINVSIIQLQQPGFAEVVSRVLEETGILPEYLEIEITESALIESSHIVVNNLDCLKNQGVKITIDDFGTGYSCLEYLQMLSVNSLKIDKKFISNIKVDINKAIVDAVISLGHKLNMEITAEGVETQEQYHYLKDKKCDKVQGYYFSKPLLPEKLIEVLDMY